MVGADCLYKRLKLCLVVCTGIVSCNYGLVEARSLSYKSSFLSLWILFQLGNGVAIANFRWMCIIRIFDYCVCSSVILIYYRRQCFFS